MPTYKTSIIEKFFRERYDEESKTLKNPVVSLEEVKAAIAARNLAETATDSDKNPANFIKDFMRNVDAANENWPVYVREQGYRCRHRTGKGAHFEFVRIPDDRLLPFKKFVPSDKTISHKIQSVSLPLASRRLGRRDEPWMIQVITRLKIVESHFSLSSGRAMRQLDLLQMSVKLSGTEIDALFLAHEEIEKGKYEETIVTCEAKVGRDDILEDQILRQAQAPFKMKTIDQDQVIPIAIKCVAPSVIYICEFEALTRANHATTDALVVAHESLFEIKPSVPGICQ